MNEGSFLEMHRTGRRYWWYQAREKLMAKLLDGYRYSPLISGFDRVFNGSSERIVDIGCGTGTMFDFLAQWGWVVGIEPVESAIDYAALHKSALLVQATSDCLPVKGKSMDVVGMFDCLEHMDDDLMALREARRIITDSGVLLITVPAFPWLISRREKQLGHKRRYSKLLLHRILTQAGFQISFMRYMYATLFPFLVLKMVKDKLTPPPSHERSDIAMLSEPWNSILAHWFHGEAFICEKWGLPFGTSIACVAHPKNAIEKKLENRETAA